MCPKYKVVARLAIVLILNLLCSVSTIEAEPIIADHVAVTQFDNIPTDTIVAIGSNFNIYYVHTSHGSQIVTGIDMVEIEDPTYDPPPFYRPGDDLGHNGDTSWVPSTRVYLNNHAECNMAMFSWCGGCSDNTVEGINIYLNKMDELEADYPSVQFIYMTGHLDGTGTGGNLYACNNQIRDYCTTNDKVLFDFADIESWDPDGNYYPDETDACNWCNDWCATHTCPSCGSCAHSHCFNCYLKGKAWWWMMARVSGWSPSQDPIPHIVTTLPTVNELNVSKNSDITVTFDHDMDAATIGSPSFVVAGQFTGLHNGSYSFAGPPANRATFVPAVPFAVGEIVTVVITTGIESNENIPLDSSYTWSFTVEVEAGTGLFSPGANHSVVEYPLAMIAADLDGDNYVDLAVVGSGNVSVLMNGGDGSFYDEVVYPVGQWPFGICAADFDLDGHIDLATVNETTELQVYVSILMNNSDGTFASFMNYVAGTTGGQPVSIAAADLNGDGYPDLATANNGDNTVSVLSGVGDGSFSIFTEYAVGPGPGVIRAADIDNDADIDLMVGNIYTNSFSVLLNNRYGTFAPHTTYACYDHPRSIVVADFDGDSYLDIATASEDGEYMGFLSVVPNLGDGTFGSFASKYLGYSMGLSICAADLDNEGTLDLAVTLDYDGLDILLNNGYGSFGTYTDYTVGSHPAALIAADLDGDGDIDLATANQYDANVTVLYNQNPACCENRGNVDHNNGTGEPIDIADLTYLVSYLFRSGPPPPCEEEGNIDGIIDTGGPIDIADLTYLVAYLFTGGATPPAC
ncbi:MAG: VCBS repeat-containing protein [candidate division Zixibacteria bacterium]|nr:VCBS repeat-containing protein [candidate division Zixibacteria bacterium]